jgi:uncharacterized membrane protein YphA (DoxX/SURF4 family)
MKTRTLAYWITTGLLAFAFLGGGLFDLSGSPEVDAQMAHLGYPAYLGPLLGVWKVLGALAILVPGMPRLKEWAYAGMMFDLSGAVVSHVAVGDAVAQFFPAIVLLGILAASWALRPAGRVLAGAKEESSTRPLGLGIRQPQAA